MAGKDCRGEMLALRGDGWSLQKIANLYGVSRERVRQIIGNTGRSTSEIELAVILAKKGQERHSLSLEQRINIVRAYSFDELTEEQIAEKFGVSVKVVGQVLDEPLDS